MATCGEGRFGRRRVEQVAPAPLHVIDVGKDRPPREYVLSGWPLQSAASPAGSASHSDRHAVEDQVEQGFRIHVRECGADAATTARVFRRRGNEDGREE